MFVNHELSKLALGYPQLSSVIIYLGLAFLSFVYFKKTQEVTFLSRIVTNQLRGFAILLVIVGHIGVHVLSPEQQIYFPVIAKYGVAVFFILSGFGLSRSYSNKPLKAGCFVIRRLSRVMIPYWIVTMMIVSLDYLILKRSYAWHDLFLTFLGVNSSEVTRHIDYVRWYITVLLLWYSLFAILWKWKIRSKQKKAIAFLVVGILLVFINYYCLQLGYAFMSFPSGVIIGLYYNKISFWYSNIPRNRLFLFSSIILLGNVVFWYYFGQKMDDYLPGIVLYFMREFSWIIVFFCIVFFCSLLIPRYSVFLYTVGIYSYGLFLTHGVLMVRYDLILYKSYLFITFWIYMIYIMLVSIVLEKFVFKSFVRKIYRLTTGFS